MREPAARNVGGLALLAAVLGAGLIATLLWWRGQAVEPPLVSVEPASVASARHAESASVRQVSAHDLAEGATPSDVGAQTGDGMGDGMSVAGARSSAAAAPKAGPGTASAALRGQFKARNAFGRTGAYYLPAGYAQGPRPLVVFFHGTNANGSVGLGQLQALAQALALFVVAPDSGQAPDGTATWQVGDRPGDRTADLEHTLACLREFYALPDVQVSHALALGYSGGGSSAPYLATQDARFDAFGVLHGGVYPGGWGGASPRAWFSTGAQDTWRPVSQVQAAAEQTRARGLHVTWRQFPGGHGLAQAELEAVLSWWLER